MHDAIVGQVVERLAQGVVWHVAVDVVRLEWQLERCALEVLHQNLDIVRVDARVLDGPVEGLIHISELSNRRIQHPKDVVKEECRKSPARWRSEFRELGRWRG